MERKMNMKDHRKFYNWLRFMAVVSIAVGGILVIWLTASGALVPSKADNLPSSFWVSPAHRIMTGVMVLVSSLSGIAFGVCNFMCKLKAVGILAIVKAVCILGFIFVYWGSHKLKNQFFLERGVGDNLFLQTKVSTTIFHTST